MTAEVATGTVAIERDKELSLIQHIGELRDRMVKAAIALVGTTVVSFFFTEHLIRLLVLPVDCQFIPTFVCDSTPTKLISLNPTENFTTFFRVALFAGIAFAMPVILYEVYAYIDPALLPNERRFIRFMGLPVIGLFIAGMLFCYFLLLPNAIKFLINFGSGVIENELRAADYLSFVTLFILGMGVLFEVPAIIFALVKINIVSRAWLAKQRRYVVLIVFLLGAFITPTPDPFNQTMVAIPIYLLFELGLFLSRWASREPRPGRATAT